MYLVEMRDDEAVVVVLAISLSGATKFPSMLRWLVPSWLSSVEKLNGVHISQIDRRRECE